MLSGGVKSRTFDGDQVRATIHGQAVPLHAIVVSHPTEDGPGAFGGVGYPHHFEEVELKRVSAGRFPALIHPLIMPGAATTVQGVAAGPEPHLIGLVSGSSTGGRRGAGVVEVPSLLSSAVEKVVEAIALALRKRGRSR
jgi:hypothetical protein